VHPQPCHQLARVPTSVGPNLRSLCVPRTGRLYHVTDVRNAISIIRGGLKAGPSGHIFLFAEKPISPWLRGNSLVVVTACPSWERLAEKIAVEQLGAADGYVVFCVDLVGISGPLEADRVAEITAPFHRAVKQCRIAARFLWPKTVVLPRQAKGSAKRIAENIRHEFLAARQRSPGT